LVGDHRLVMGGWCKARRSRGGSSSLPVAAVKPHEVALELSEDFLLEKVKITWLSSHTAAQCMSTHSCKVLLRVGNCSCCSAYR